MADFQGIMPPQYNTPIGQVRLKSGDRFPTQLSENGSPVTGQGIYWWYSDAEIQALLDMAGGKIGQVVYEILMSVSLSQVLLLKKFTSADLAADGPAIAAEIRLQARQIRDDLKDLDDAAAVEYVQVVPTGGPALALPPWVEPEAQLGYVVL